MTINNCRGSGILPMKSTTIMTESLCKGGISVSRRLGSNSTKNQHKIWQKLNSNTRAWTPHQVTMYLLYDEFFVWSKCTFFFIPVQGIQIVESGVKWRPHHHPPPKLNPLALLSWSLLVGPSLPTAYLEQVKFNYSCVFLIYILVILLHVKSGN